MLVQDADLEYDPRIIQLAGADPGGQADVVYGTRFYGGGAHRVLFFWHYMGNLALTLMSNMLTNLNLSDMEVGYKVFRAEAVKGINLKPTASASSRRSPSSSPRNIAASTKSPSLTMAAPMKRGKKSPGKTASRRSTI